jgi:uncharacterized membrane protein
MLQRIGRQELWQAQLALLVAIALQFAASHFSHELLPEAHYGIIGIELTLVVLLGFTARTVNQHARRINHLFAVGMLAILSAANIAALVVVLHSLIIERTITDGKELLASAAAIFLTNIIVYALWYWEIDSPGLTGKRWSRNDKDFQFTQQDMQQEFPTWRPQFADYLFVSITNAVNFAPADTRPLTRAAKMLMASQALVSVFTLALLIARSVSILGT